MILIVEDNKIDQFITSQIVSKTLGVNAHVVNNGVEALQWLKNNESNEKLLIFLDIRMPKMNGLEFLESIDNYVSSDFENIDVIVLTSSLDEEDYKRATKSSYVKQFINKPLTRENLKKGIKDY